MIRLIGAFILLAAICSAAASETFVVISEDKILARGAFGATVSLKTDDSVSSIQFDVQTGGLTFVSATPSSELLLAGKSISTTVLRGDTLRVIVFGLNNNAIPSGTLMSLVFDSQEISQPLLQVSNVIVSDPKGNEVLSRTALSAIPQQTIGESTITSDPIRVPADSTRVKVEIDISGYSGDSDISLEVSQDSGATWKFVASLFVKDGIYLDDKGVPQDKAFFDIWPIPGAGNNERMFRIMASSKRTTLSSDVKVYFK